MVVGRPVEVELVDEGGMLGVGGEEDDGAAAGPRGGEGDEVLLADLTGEDAGAGVPRGGPGVTFRGAVVKGG